MNYETYLEQFDDYYDAMYWVDGHLDDHPPIEWEVVELRVNFLGEKYRAGVAFKRLHQLEFEFNSGEDE
jgi:hypothetical protein